MPQLAPTGQDRRAAATRTTVVLVAILALAVVVSIVAPDERTLGRGIKSVYVHVALTLAGMMGVCIAGALGALGLFSTRQGPNAWMVSIGRVGLLLFAAGVAVSLVAARLNWGGVLLQEPLLRMSVLLVGVSWIAHLAMPLFPVSRWQAALSLVPVLGLVTLVMRAPRVLHPPGDVLPSAPPGMLLTFASLTVLFLLAGAQLSWHLRRRYEGS